MAPDAIAKRDNDAGGGRAAEIESSHQQKVLDTPRTREACKKLGLILEDLNYKGYENFGIPGDKKELQQLRYEHAEKKRKERLGQVLAERAKVIASNAKKGDVPGVQSGQFLGMLESLFEKEAKRLEADLKSQLRQHSSLVAANESQLLKEEQMATKIRSRELKKQELDDKRDEAINVQKAKRGERVTHTNELIDKLKKDHVEKQAEQARTLVYEEERMQKWRGEQALLNGEKSAHWKEKCQRIKDKNKQMVVDRRIEGEAKLVELEGKIGLVAQRRNDEQGVRIVRSEEQHLHLMDVREQKDRIDRVDGFRRAELSDQISGNVERIETLLALKDQLLSQRKGRQMKAEATKGSRGLNLGRDCGPGPGQYEAPKSCMFENPVPKVAQSKTGHSEFIDSVTRTTACNPPPGAYAPTRLKNGDVVSESGAGGGKFGGGDRVSFLDDACKAKAAVPAPGRYELKSTIDDKGTKMKRARVDNPGLDKHSAKNFPVWARPGVDTPGPAGYSVDDYTRKEVLRRAQRSLPSLTKDMLTGATKAS